MGWMDDIQKKAAEAQQSAGSYVKWSDFEGAVAVFWLPDSEFVTQVNRHGDEFLNLTVRKLKIYVEGELTAHYDYYANPQENEQGIRLPCNANLEARIKNRVEDVRKDGQGRNAPFVPAEGATPVADACVCVLAGYENVGGYTDKSGQERKGFHKIHASFHVEKSEPYNDLWTEAPIKLIERE